MQNQLYFAEDKFCINKFKLTQFAFLEFEINKNWSVEDQCWFSWSI